MSAAWSSDLERRDCDRHGFSSNPTRVILFVSLGKALYNTFACLVILASGSKFQSHLYKTNKKQKEKFLADSNILASPEAG